jgi:hypothetical protein
LVSVKLKERLVSGLRRNDGKEKIDFESTPTKSLGFEPKVVYLIASRPEPYQTGSKVTARNVGLRFANPTSRKWDEFPFFHPGRSHSHQCIKA